MQWIDKHISSSCMLHTLLEKPTQKKNTKKKLIVQFKVVYTHTHSYTTHTHLYGISIIKTLD